MLTVLEIIKKTTDFFAAKGIESPRLNAEMLIGRALKRQRMQLYLEFERLLSEPELEQIRPLVRRRAQHEPLQYILGDTEFYGLKLKVDRRALIPRPETEQLLEHVVATYAAASPPTRILDLGTGSGALALGLARAFPGATVLGIDVDADALNLAQENAVSTALTERVTFLRSTWFAAVPAGKYDLIVSNPPYLSAEETAQTSPEVQGHEPTRALTASDGGIADLAAIVAQAPAFLVSGGLLALETGITHHERLLALSETAGFARRESKRDLSGRDRFFLAVL